MADTWAWTGSTWKKLAPATVPPAREFSGLAYDSSTSGGDFARRIGFAVPLQGIRTTGVVRCDQPRVLDIQARMGRKIDTLPAEILDEVLARTATLFA